MVYVDETFLYFMACKQFVLANLDGSTFFSKVNLVSCLGWNLQDKSFFDFWLIVRLTLQPNMSFTRQEIAYHESEVIGWFYQWTKRTNRTKAKDIHLKSCWDHATSYSSSNKNSFSFSQVMFFWQWSRWLFTLTQLILLLKFGSSAKCQDLVFSPFFFI